MDADTAQMTGVGVLFSGQLVPAEAVLSSGSLNHDSAPRPIIILSSPKRVSEIRRRYWTADLTQLRQIYTYWRSRARAARREG
jgi:hypothetical protein